MKRGQSHDHGYMRCDGARSVEALSSFPVGRGGSEGMWGHMGARSTRRRLLGTAYILDIIDDTAGALLTPDPQ